MWSNVLLSSRARHRISKSRRPRFCGQWGPCIVLSNDIDNRTTWWTHHPSNHFANRVSTGGVPLTTRRVPIALWRTVLHDPQRYGWSIIVINRTWSCVVRNVLQGPDRVLAHLVYSYLRVTPGGSSPTIGSAPSPTATRYTLTQSSADNGHSALASYPTSPTRTLPR